PEIYTLSLHDALPIFAHQVRRSALRGVEDLARVDAELQIDRGREVLRAVRAANRAVAAHVGGADDLPARRAGAGEQHRHRVAPVDRKSTRLNPVTWPS